MQISPWLWFSYAAPYTRVGVIDPETRSFLGYVTGLEPGLRVMNVLEVNGHAWLFNELSHIEEHAPRTDVYVLDPASVEIVDRFNLGHPFPIWAAKGEEGKAYIFHKVPREHLRQAGYSSGVTELDLATGEEKFLPSHLGFAFKDLDVYRGLPCLAYRTLRESEESGLWCVNQAGTLEQQIQKDYAIGVLFVPSVSR